MPIINKACKMFVDTNKKDDIINGLFSLKVFVNENTYVYFSESVYEHILLINKTPNEANIYFMLPVLTLYSNPGGLFTCDNNVKGKPGKVKKKKKVK